MEHDRKCEFETWGYHWKYLDFLTDDELRVIKAHYLCFCARRRRGEMPTSLEQGALKDRWRLVRDNYRNKVGQEEREQARLKLTGGERDGVASVTDLADFRKKRNARSHDSIDE